MQMVMMLVGVGVAWNDIPCSEVLEDEYGLQALSGARAVVGGLDATDQALSPLCSHFGSTCTGDGTQHHCCQAVSWLLEVGGSAVELLPQKALTVAKG